jgi:uncharacterized protein (TIRG00374 family)
MKKEILAGVALSALLTYLSVRGIDLAGLGEGLRKAQWGETFWACILMALMQVLRALRWGVILRPLARIAAWPLFAVSNVGFLAIVALPARLGELVRPYLIAKKSPLSMSAALGTILVERVIDMLSVLLIGLSVLLLIPVPPWLVRATGLLAGGTLLLALLLFLLIRRPSLTQRLMASLARWLPERYRPRARRLGDHFLAGFQVLSAPRLFFSVMGLSLAIWLVDVYIIQLLLRAFGWQLPVSAPFVVMLVLIAGIAIPTAPGFVGNWHYCCILALGLFGIPKAEALPFAVLYHALSVSVILVLGLAFLPANRFSLTAMRRESSPNGISRRP